jgi:HEAT repeat protein
VIVPAVIGLAVIEIGWALLLAVFLAATMVSKSAGRKRAALAARVQPEICESVALYMGVNNDLARLRGFAESHPRELEAAILESQANVRGSARERLGDLAIELRLVERWIEGAHSRHSAVRRQAFSAIAGMADHEGVRRFLGDVAVTGLHDADEQIRLDCARLIARCDSVEQIREVFDLSLKDTPLMRLLVSHELRRHALGLCVEAVPRALRSPHWKTLVVALKLAGSWECSLPLAVSLLAEHPKREVRIETMRLLPFVPPTQEHRSAVKRCLGDEDLAVCCAAASAAGRLRMVEAIPLLTSCLRRGSVDLAVTAAASLASMNSAGCRALEDQARIANPIASRAARQALEGLGRAVCL